MSEANHQCPKCTANAWTHGVGGYHCHYCGTPQPTVSAEGRERLVTALLDAAFNILQHDNGEGDKEYDWARGKLKSKFAALLATMDPIGDRGDLVLERDQLRAKVDELEGLRVNPQEQTEAGAELSDHAIGDEPETADLHMQWASDGDDLERSFNKLHAYAKGLEAKLQSEAPKAGTRGTDIKEAWDEGYETGHKVGKTGIRTDRDWFQVSRIALREVLPDAPQAVPEPKISNMCEWCNGLGFTPSSQDPTQKECIPCHGTGRIYGKYSEIRKDQGLDAPQAGDRE